MEIEVEQQVSTPLLQKEKSNSFFDPFYSILRSALSVTLKRIPGYPISNSKISESNCHCKEEKKEPKKPIQIEVPVEKSPLKIPVEEFIVKEQAAVPIEQTPEVVVEQMATLQSFKIDVVFSLDTTGSMSAVIAKVKKSLEGLICNLFKDIPSTLLSFFWM